MNVTISTTENVIWMWMSGYEFDLNVSISKSVSMSLCVKIWFSGGALLR